MTVDTKKQQTYRISDRLSFKTGSLDHDVVIFCPVTGIIGKLEMPYLPVNLVYTHPLATADNALKLVGKYLAVKSMKYADIVVSPAQLQQMFLELDRQVLAGCVLSLLRAQGKLRTEAETTAVEQNLCLQSAGSETLCTLLGEILRRWDNPLVWKRMPGLNVEPKTYGLLRSEHLNDGIGYTLQHYAKLLRNALNASELTQTEAAKIFEAQKRQSFPVGRRIKVYSASAVQHRNIKDAKPEAHKLFDSFKEQLSIVLRTKVSKAIRDMLVLPLDYKLRVCFELQTAKLEGEAHQDNRLTLIRILKSSTTENILAEMGTLSQEISPLPTKSIAEILASKKAKAADKQEHVAARETKSEDTKDYLDSTEPEAFGFDDVEGKDHAK